MSDLEKNSFVSDLESLPVRHLSRRGTNPAARSSTVGSPLRATLHRTSSVSILNGPARVNPSHRIPVNFRTLSIQVTDTHSAAVKPHAKHGDATDLSLLDWHKLTAEEVTTRLGTSPTLGLDVSIHERRLKKYGENKISPAPSNLARKIFFYIFGGFGGLLTGASIICFLAWKPLGNPDPQASNLALAVVLLIVVAIQAAFNAWQDYSTGRVMASISGMLPQDVLVVRDGSILQVSATQLTTGDLVKITLGCKIPADLRLVQASSDLKFDRSILTGESIPVDGTIEATDPNFMESKNICLQGTLCTEGSGIGVCVGTGDSTVFARIARQATQERPVRTTLEIEISRFVLIIGGMALSVAVLIVILWASWLRRDHPGFINVPSLLIDCVSVAVAFIPEGLPVCVTLSLTVIAGSMKKKNILCKSLSTVEALGCVSVICSDKTGTLTQNRMSVVNVVVGSSTTSVSSARDLPQGTEADLFKVVAAMAGLCNDASFEAGEGSDEKALENRKINGDATDSGLLRFAEGVLSVARLRQTWSETAKLAFNSKNKFAVKIFTLSGVDPSQTSAAPLLPHETLSGDQQLLIVKGAPDILLGRCSHFVNANGDVETLSPVAVQAIREAQGSLAGRGQRVILFAKKLVKPFAANIRSEDAILNSILDLTVVGMAALEDPLRDDTRETVEVCRRAGIRFMMVTGDFALTAGAIAAQCGIFTGSPSALHGIKNLRPDLALDQVSTYDDSQPDGTPISSLLLSGSDLITMNESQWKQVLSYDEVVFSRTSPQQKLNIVRAYQAAGNTVCVTGDGVNDAAALKQADVGVAVAGGSEVAIEAADLILLDQFSAIVKGIESGRICFENLRKSILYLLPAGSFSELMPVLVNILFGLPQPLSNVQMILICVATDVLPALSLVHEKAEADLLLRKPRNRKTDRIADLRLIGHAYFFIGVLESLTAMTGAYYFGFQKNGIPFSSLWLKYGDYNVDADLLATVTAKAQSIYFFNLVLMQWFNLLATRTRRLSIFQQNPLGSSETRNLYLVPAMLMALILGIFFSYIPFFQSIFLTRGVAVEYYFLPMAYGVVVLLLDEGRKWWVRQHPGGVLSKVAW